MSRTDRGETLDRILKKRKIELGLEKAAADMRITELLERNLKLEIEKDVTGNRKRQQPIEGDLPVLALRYEYFMGVKIGWPFPEMNKPQKLMAMHIIKGLNSSQHVVLESPTGTGEFR